MLKNNGEVAKKEARLLIAHKKKVVFKSIPTHFIGKRLSLVYKELRGLPNLAPHRIAESWNRNRLPDGLIVGRLIVFFDAPTREYHVKGERVQTLQAFSLDTRGILHTSHLSFEREADEQMYIAVYE